MVRSAASSFAEPAPGQLVGGRFELEREIGRGGMGSVYAALDRDTGARVALKLMRRELAGDERALERFRREGTALAAIHHPPSCRSATWASSRTARSSSRWSSSRARPSPRASSAPRA